MIANLLRGILIGTAEVIPGVSGGTIALVVGVYERIISSAASAVDALISLLKGRPSETKSSLVRIDWALIVPLLMGMLVAIVAAAAAIEPLLAREPENMRGLFAGLILASLVVPYRMVGSRWSLGDYLFGGVSAVIAFALVSLPRQDVSEPNLILVSLAAAIAVCALVLPGVSGSFLLLAMGFYAPTISAVNDFNLTYLAVFVMGAVFGLAIFASALRWLLTNFRRVTLVFMTGLMLGSLRALWPWQDQSGGVSEVSSLQPLAFFALGAALVVFLIWLQSRSQKAQ